MLRFVLPLLVLLTGALFTAPAVAQTPVPAPVPTATDTSPRDTVRIAVPPEGVVSDTLPRDTLRSGVPDTLRPAPHIPRFPEVGRVGFAEARWVWTRDELLRFHNLSLVELLGRIPGLDIIRAGGAGSPAGTTTAGLGGGRLRVFRDGFELDPLNVTVLDLQEIGLIDLDLVRVERTLTETRIHLRTFQLRDMRPFSELELGTGNFQARFLRALFVRPVFGGSVLSASFDLSNAGRYRLVEPSGFTTARVRWDHALGDRSGVQVEYLFGSVNRESAVLPTDFERRELVLRGRTALGENLQLEAVAGRASHIPDLPGQDPLTGVPETPSPATDTLDFRASVTQFGARALWRPAFGFLEGNARARAGAGNAFSGPGLEVGARAGVQPAGWIGAEAGVRGTSLAAGGATEMEVVARLGPAAGVTLFGALAAGERWVTWRADTLRALPDTVDAGGAPVQRFARDVRLLPVRSGVAGTRFGGELSTGRVRLSGAIRSSAATTIVPFGFGFDRRMPVLEVGAATGYEASAWLAAPGALQGLTAEAWYTHWTDRGGRPYLPSREGMAALVFTGEYLEGQFEPHVRLEGTYRGNTLVPSQDQQTLVDLPPYHMLNFNLQLRILDVRAFFLFENLLNELQAEPVAGRLLPGARTMYGIRWFFRN